jgi:hypothetical protein
MKRQANHPHSTLAPGLEAISNLWLQDLDNFVSNASLIGLTVHSKIEDVAVAQKSVADWYILACSGENRLIQPIVSVCVDPGTTATLTIPIGAPSLPPERSWRAPAWLFSVFPPLTGIGRMKQNHVPATDSEEELSAAHSRFILKGARRVFLWELAAAIETIRDEETAAAAAVPARVSEQPQATKKKRARQFRGVEALGQKKADLARYTDTLTDKQQLARSRMSTGSD